MSSVFFVHETGIKGIYIQKTVIGISSSLL